MPVHLRLRLPRHQVSATGWEGTKALVEKVLKRVGAPHSPRLSHTCVPLQLGPEVAVAGTAGSDFVNASLEPVQSRSWFWQPPTASHISDPEPTARVGFRVSGLSLHLP